MQLSVIIVSYNVKHFLEQCLYSLKRACRNVEAEVWVVDNHSTDDSLAYLQPRFSEVKFIINNMNEGFAKANNQALARATGEYILFLNPDTLVAEDSIEKCLAFMRVKTDCGLLGVHMIDGNGRFLKESKRGIPTLANAFCKMSGLATLFPSSPQFSGYYLGHLPEKENHTVDVIAGAFMMAPSALLKKTGGFDEQFFMYGEDVDLSYRVQKAGFGNYYFAGTSIVHFKGESSPRRTGKQVRVFYEAMTIFVKKHFTGKGSASFFVYPTIKLLCMLAIAKNAVLQLLIQKEKPTTGNKCIVVGSDESYHLIVTHFQKNHWGRKILGYLNKEPAGQNGCLGSIETLAEGIKKTHADELIFCANGLDYSTIISLLMKEPLPVQKKFHAYGSQSLVGANESIEFKV